MKILRIVICLLIASSCSSRNTAISTSEKELIKAKIVRLSCASTVIQIIDESYTYLGQTWTEMGTNKKVANAVNVINKCDVPKYFKEGDLFYFRLIDKSEASQQCIACTMMDFPPEKSIYIRVK